MRMTKPGQFRDMQLKECYERQWRMDNPEKAEIKDLEKELDLRIRLNTY